MPELLDDLETYWAAATRGRSHFDGRELIELAEAPLVLPGDGSHQRRVVWRVASVAAVVIVLVGFAALLLANREDRADRIAPADDVTPTEVSVTAPESAADSTPTDGIAAVPDEDDGEPHPPPPISSIPDASLEGHPQQSFLEDDREGQALAEAFREQRETGWAAVQLTPKLIGWIPLEFKQTAVNGSVSEVANGDGEMVGYYIMTLGYVDTATFESPGFDWKAWARSIEWFPGVVIEEDIAEIEAQGGLGEVYRIPDLTP